MQLAVRRQSGRRCAWLGGSTMRFMDLSEAAEVRGTTVGRTTWATGGGGHGEPAGGGADAGLRLAGRGADAGLRLAGGC